MQQRPPDPFAAFDPFSSQPGPSKPSKSNQGHHRPRSSSDFGSFNSAPPSHFPQRQTTSQNAHILHQDDLLGSFDDTHLNYPLIDNPNHVDEAYERLAGRLSGSDAQQHSGQPPGSRNLPPLHIALPPRPTDISPDYVPPRRTPRRLSTTFSTFSPGSPPLVSDIGSDIVFHPSHQLDADGALAEMRKVQSATSRNLADHHPLTVNHVPTDGSLHLPRSPPHSRLLDTLATTTKMASKFRSALNHATFIPPHVDLSTISPDQIPPSTGPLSIDVTHSSPFVSAEQLAGSYTAPSGAPSFDSKASASQPDARPEDDWGHVHLRGRKPTTTPVMTDDVADRLRRELPPRQRLASAWTLLFSLDQHGASLNTLYRLVEGYRSSHRTAGNILVVQDGAGNRFGVFMNESIVKREGTFYGTGEVFLYKLSPVSDIKPFRWTGKNQYFALCETDFISFGGGGGAYGLILDKTFSRNSSATCPAFDNEVLCENVSRRSGSAVPFDCVGLEVWGT